MPNRPDTPPLDDPSSDRDIRIHTDSESTDSEGPEPYRKESIPSHLPLRTLSSSVMNMPHITTDPSLLRSSTGTIRSVPSDTALLDANSQDESPIVRVQSNSDSDVSISQPKNSYNSSDNSKPPLSRQNQPPALGMSRGIVRSISSEFGPTKYSNSNVHVVEESPISANGVSPNGVSPNGQWSSAIGKANLGKSGRVIERLTKENDMLKRDVKIERLRAEDAIEQARLAEGKVSQANEEWERRLRDATMNSSLLKRKERQVTDLKEKVDSEKQRADKAIENERFWKAEMQRVERECKEKVEEAQIRADLFEGRNNAMASHWKDQGADVDRTVAKLGKEIEAIVKERRADDEKISMLQQLCEQQAEQLRGLQKEKDDIASCFENYKREQEESLASIKDMARKQEKANEETLTETQNVLGELKWALNVKNNVKGAG
ncbi:mother-specific HO expression [Clarireedia jacksonii]